VVHYSFDLVITKIWDVSYKVSYVVLFLSAHSFYFNTLSYRFTGQCFSDQVILIAMFPWHSKILKEVEFGKLGVTGN